MKPLELTGQKFGRLEVLRRLESKNGQTRWECLCDCGVVKNVAGQSLVREQGVRSCGCLAHEAGPRLAERNRKHGHTWTGGRSPTYQSWIGMKSRCFSPTNVGFEHYGGRGITVCEQWRYSFETFLRDMGERPDGTSLDRLDVDGNYEPDNCQWATPRSRTQISALRLSRQPN